MRFSSRLVALALGIVLLLAVAVVFISVSVTELDAPPPANPSASGVRRFWNRLPVAAPAEKARHPCIRQGASVDDIGGEIRAKESEDGSPHSRAKFSRYFDRVYYVNYARDEGKRDVMRALLSNYGVEGERVELVDERDADIQKQWQNARRQIDITFGENANKPGVMSTISDYILLRTMSRLLDGALRRQYRRILVLSDTVRFISDFDAHFERIARAVPADWKLLHLGLQQHSWSASAAGIPSDPRLQGMLYHPLSAFDGAFAVGIDMSVFDILQFEIMKATRAFALGPLRAVSVLYPRYVYAALPNLVVDDVLAMSLIRTNKAKLAQFRWDLTQYETLPPPAPLPRVCVVMTMHNAESTVEHSVRSLIAQTYSKIDIIAVDDASTDNTYNVLRRLSEEDRRVVLIRNERNLGPYTSRNVGLKSCTGDAYMNLDADDLSAPDRVATQLQPLIDNRAEITTSLYIRTHAKPEELQGTWDEVWPRVQAARIHARSDSTYAFCCSENLALGTVMIKMSVFEKLGAGWRDFRFGGDGEFLERYLAVVLRLFFWSSTMNIYRFLAKTPPLPPYYERIGRALYIAADRNSSLSHAIPIGGEERLSQRRHYQGALLEEAGLSADTLTAADVYDD